MHEKSKSPLQEPDSLTLLQLNLPLNNLNHNMVECELSMCLQSMPYSGQSHFRSFTPGESASSTHWTGTGGSQNYFEHGDIEKSMSLSGIKT
jgi:hypothetical protein